VEIKYLEIKPLSPFHLGEGGLDTSSKYIHSDTLFSAMVNAIRINKGRDSVEDFVSNFRDGNTRISSVFPKLEGIFLFPKLLLRFDEDSDKRDRKMVKKAMFVSKMMFERLINEGKYPKDLHIKKGIIGSDNELKKIELGRDWIKSEVLERFSRVSSGNEDHSLFNIATTIYDSANLYVLVKGKIDIVEESLKMLEDLGIGGKISSGMGQIKFVGRGNLELNVPKSTDYCTTLSLFTPRRNELNCMLDKGVAYKFVTRGGWISSPDGSTVKRGVGCFLEGSIFKQPIDGVLVDVSPKNFPHEVYKYLKAFVLPVMESD